MGDGEAEADLRGSRVAVRFVWQWSLAEDYDVGARVAYNI